MAALSQPIFPRRHCCDTRIYRQPSLARARSGTCQSVHVNQRTRTRSLVGNLDDRIAGFCAVSRKRKIQAWFPSAALFHFCARERTMLCSSTLRVHDARHRRRQRHGAPLGHRRRRGHHRTLPRTRGNTTPSRPARTPIESAARGSSTELDSSQTRRCGRNVLL
jgi:hypothetical protein